jgi:hypothetical protein
MLSLCGFPKIGFRIAQNKGIAYCRVCAVFISVKNS